MDFPTADLFSRLAPNILVGPSSAAESFCTLSELMAIVLLSLLVFSCDIPMLFRGCSSLTLADPSFFTLITFSSLLNTFISHFFGSSRLAMGCVSFFSFKLVCGLCFALSTKS